MPEKTYGANVYFTNNPDEIDNEITFDANKPIPARTPATQASAPSAPTNTPAQEKSKATEIIEAKPRVLDKKAVYYTNDPAEIDNVITFDASKPLPDVGSESANVAEPVVEDVTPAYEEAAAEPVYEEPEAEPVYEEPAAEPVYEEPIAEPIYEEPVAEPVYEEAPAYEVPVTNDVVAVSTLEDAIEEPALEEKNKKKKCVIASVLGILSIPFSLIALLVGVACSCTCGMIWGSIISIVFAIVGFVLGLVSLIVSIIKVRRPSIFGIIGIILSVLTIVIAILFTIIAIVANIGLNIFANIQY